MADVVRPHAGRRWARLLALLALAPTDARAQAPAPACSPSPPWNFTSEYYVSPTAVRAVGESMLVVGEPGYRFGRRVSGDAVIADSTIAAMLVSRDGGLRVIPRPAGASAFVHPRLVPRSGGRFDVLWSEPSADSSPVSGAITQLVHVSTLADMAWQSRTTLGRFEMFAQLTREMGSDLVTVGGVTYLAFPDETASPESQRLVLLSDSGGRWSAIPWLPGLASTGSAELGEDAGGLVAVFLGINPERPAGQGSVSQTVWIARRANGRWGGLQEIGGDRQSSVQYPKLVRRGDALVAAWLIADGEPSLEWREVTAGRPLGPLHRIDGIAKMSQGQAPFRDVLSLITLQGTSRIVRLRPDGLDDVASIPVIAPFPPVVAGTLERPWALTVAETAPGETGPFRLVAHDLRCALRR